MSLRMRVVLDLIVIRGAAAIFVHRWRPGAAQKSRCHRNSMVWGVSWCIQRPGRCSRLAIFIAPSTTPFFGVRSLFVDQGKFCSCLQATANLEWEPSQAQYARTNKSAVELAQHCLSGTYAVKKIDLSQLQCVMLNRRKQAIWCTSQKGNFTTSCSNPLESFAAKLLSGNTRQHCLVCVQRKIWTCVWVACSSGWVINECNPTKRPPTFKDKATERSAE